MSTVNYEIRNSIARIEVMNDGDAYWEAGSIVCFDDDDNEIDVDIDYSKTNQPFEDLTDMLQRVADYFDVDVDIVELCD